MDCNSYSYTAPGFGVDAAPRKYTPVDTVTIERRTANNREYYVILAGDGSIKTYDLDTAIRTAANWLKEGV